MILKQDEIREKETQQEGINENSMRNFLKCEPYCRTRGNRIGAATHSPYLLTKLPSALGVRASCPCHTGTTGVPPVAALWHLDRHLEEANGDVHSIARHSQGQTFHTYCSKTSPLNIFTPALCSFFSGCNSSRIINEWAIYMPAQDSYASLSHRPCPRNFRQELLLLSQSA